ncbi:hypothetical protein [Salsipaludibacter albus]|uniref:hypothetical protein n=1 Tax=Salsipaludibacter albus TaxID=2849650 RepID=UPI001EE4DCF4|nr:hypothetical protein [Salsipaludibacter albus]MBY5164139.1 hypothetical protein [Salsipaludibacter albus]
MTRPALVAPVVIALALVGCGPDAGQRDDASPTSDPTSSPTTTDTATGEQRHPDVVDASLARTGDTWEVAATISSPYDTPERYADAFRVVTPDGTVLGIRELLHDHAGEQPFTRSLTGLEIPDDVEAVVVEARDLEHGWGGATVEVTVPR